MLFSFQILQKESFGATPDSKAMQRDQMILYPDLIS